jgi:hypothetical protein
LSNDRLSYLVVSQGGTSLPSPPLTPGSTSASDEQESPSYNHDLMICATHFNGDGMALHLFANDFFGLLGSGKTISDLEALLKEELSCRWDRDSTAVCVFAVRFPFPPDPKFRPLHYQMHWKTISKSITANCAVQLKRSTSS